MRDPQRIQEIMAEIGRIWLLHPDWRLGQIIENAVNPPGSARRGEETAWLFYIEDDDMLAALKDLR